MEEDFWCCLSIEKGDVFSKLFEKSFTKNFYDFTIYRTYLFNTVSEGSLGNDCLIGDILQKPAPIAYGNHKSLGTQCLCEKH